MNHGFDKSYNSSGSIFADYKNNLKNLDQNTILYGHNRRNGTMFNALNSTLEETWYKQFENQFINFNTISKATIWQIFSIYKIQVKDVSNPISFSSNVAFFSYIDSIKQNSIYNFNVDLNDNDKILTLYTCGDNTSYRIMVHAKLIYEKQNTP